MASYANSQEYINHHLTNARMCMTDEGLGFNYECAEAGFWVWHIDTIAWSLLIGATFLYMFWRVGKKATTGVPSKTQALVELIVEFVAGLVGQYAFGMDAKDVYMKVVPTTDINTTFALSLGVFVLIIYYSLKVKGLTLLSKR